MDGTTTLLTERQTTHGEYSNDARVAMRLVDVLDEEETARGLRGQPLLLDIQRHSLRMILHKIARIVAGRADFPDHWDDICGYAKLVSDRLPPAPPESVVTRDTLVVKSDPINGAEVLGWINRKQPCGCPRPEKYCSINDGPGNLCDKDQYCLRAEDFTVEIRNGRPGRRADDCQGERKVPRY